MGCKMIWAPRAMWLNISIVHLKSEKPLRELCLQKIDEEQAGKEGPADGDDQCPLPGLRKDPFDEKGQEEKRGERKTQRGQKKIIDNQGKKGGQNPFPGIGLGKERGPGLPGLLSITSYQEGRST